MNIDPQNYSAALVLHGVILRDFALRIVIDRIFADYGPAELNIYFDEKIYCLDNFLLDNDLEIARQYRKNITFTPCQEKIYIEENIVFIQQNKELSKIIKLHEKINKNQKILQNTKNKQIIEINEFGQTIQSNKKFENNNKGDFSNFSFQNMNFSGNFIYYPFFPIFRNDSESGIQPLARQYQDAFNFRFKNGQNISSWPSERRLIILYGGSAAYSLYNSLHLGLSAQIEKIVNDNLKKRNLPANIDVIALAIPGSTVMEAVIVHTLFGARLKPEHILLHFGWNESYAAMSSDEPSYSAGIIHNKAAWDFLALQNRAKNPDRPLPKLQAARRLPCGNYLQPVLERTLQLADMASANGAHFTVGLQPSIFSRNNPHPVEKEYLTENLSASPGFAERMKRHSDCFSWIASALQKEAADLDFIDLNPLLRDIPGDRLCFFDPCHMTPSGYQAIAGAYADSILQKLCQQGEKT